MSENPRIGLVLSGGGARGAFQVGVLDALWRHPQGLAGRAPDVVSGTSAGAINGALLAAGLDPPAMLDFWLGLTREPPVRANRHLFAEIERALVRLLPDLLVLHEPARSRARRLRELIRKKHPILAVGSLPARLVEYAFTARFDLVSRLLVRVKDTYLFDTLGVREHLVRAIGGRTSITDATVRLAINVVDTSTGEVVRIVNHPVKGRGPNYVHHPLITPEIVLSSASIPLLFNPVTVDGREYWDGGLLVNTPIAPAVALGAERILPVLVTQRHEGRIGATLGDHVERLADTFLENAFNNDRKLLLARNALAQHAPETGFRRVDLLDEIRPDAHEHVFDAGSYLYFDETVMQHMFVSGRFAAQRWLEKNALRAPETRPGRAQQA